MLKCLQVAAPNQSSALPDISALDKKETDVCACVLRCVSFGLQSLMATLQAAMKKRQVALGDTVKFPEGGVSAMQHGPSSDDDDWD